MGKKEVGPLFQVSRGKGNGGIGEVYSVIGAEVTKAGVAGAESVREAEYVPVPGEADPIDRDLVPVRNQDRKPIPAWGGRENHTSPIYVANKRGKAYSHI